MFTRPKYGKYSLFKSNFDNFQGENKIQNSIYATKIRIWNPQ